MPLRHQDQDRCEFCGSVAACRGKAPESLRRSDPATRPNDRRSACPGRICGQRRRPYGASRRWILDTSASGRKPWDAVLMFKAIVLGSRCTICPTSFLEHEIGDRLSVHAIPGPRSSGPDVGRHDQYGQIASGTASAQAGIVEPLFDRFDSFLDGQRGYEAKWRARSWTLRTWRCRGNATSRRSMRGSRLERCRRDGP